MQDTGRCDEVLLAMYQKLAIICFDNGEHMRVYTTLQDIMFSCEGQPARNSNMATNETWLEDTNKMDVDMAASSSFIQDRVGQSGSLKTLLQNDLTLLLVLARIEYKLGNSDRCNALCDAILA